MLCGKQKYNNMAILNGSGNQLNSTVLNGLSSLNNAPLTLRNPLGGSQLNTPYRPNMSYQPASVPGRNNFLPFPNTQQPQNTQPNQPITPAQPRPNPGIVSSTQTRNDITQYGNQLDKMTNQEDPYLTLLQNRVTSAQNVDPNATGIDERIAAQNAGNLQKKATKDFAAYQAGLQTLGIQTGLSEHAPQLQLSAIASAKNKETQVLQDIQDKEDLAMAKAKQARLTNNAKDLKEALDEVRQYKKDKADEVQQQYNKRVQDLTVAKGFATDVYKTLQTLPSSQREAYLLQVADENNIPVGTLHAALADEQDAQRKFNLSIALQQKSLSNSAGQKPLSTAWLNYIKKNYPSVDVQAFSTQGEAEQAIADSQGFQNAVNQDYESYSDDKGFYTSDYIKSALDRLPFGISRTGFLSTIKDKLYLNKYKYAKNYGISQEEFDTLKGL